jgi:2-haloacid dehalogenase
VIRALVFDVFGTVVDWRGSIISEGSASGIEIDWARFADRWRAGYLPSMAKVRSGEMPWNNLDQLHRGLLEGCLKSFISKVFRRKRRTIGIASGTG